jgi:hypothetical protein
MSGGPEAIHQLAQIINELGVRAEILYGGADFEINKGRLSFDPVANNPLLAEYARYGPVTARRVTLTERSFVILPEMYAGWHEMFAPAIPAYWWLSWDNAFDPRGRIHNPAQQTKFFGQRHLLHLTQTFRAHMCLRERGVRRILDLVDYTDPRFTAAKPVHPNRTFTIAYNPRKAGEFAKHFFDRHPDIPSCPIFGMSKDQVRDALSRAMIYVEFGRNPGNDRMVREAACVGCIVLAKAVGGSAYFEDMPLDQRFKFEEQDVTSGKLASLIKAIAQNPVSYFEAQSFYRNYLYLEKEQMVLQVHRLLLTFSPAKNL